MPAAARRFAAVLALLALVAASPAAAGWAVDARGRCVEAWTPPRAAQGPVAMLTAPTLPFREAVGGGIVAADTTTPQGGVVGQVLAWPSLILGGFALGVGEMPIWLVLGLADTVTGGYFDLSPDDAKPLTLTSVRPRFLGAQQTTPASCAERR
jgi:hypothetical protein